LWRRGTAHSTLSGKATEDTGGVDRHSGTVCGIPVSGEEVLKALTGVRRCGQPFPASANDQRLGPQRPAERHGEHAGTRGTRSALKATPVVTAVAILRSRSASREYRDLLHPRQPVARAPSVKPAAPSPRRRAAERTSWTNPIWEQVRDRQVVDGRCLASTASTCRTRGRRSSWTARGRAAASSTLGVRHPRPPVHGSGRPPRRRT
jgi:hypothetical protein